MNNAEHPIVMEAQNLSKHFIDGTQKIEVIHDLNFQVRQGDKLAIIGPSGSGKTTLLQMLGGLDTPSAGNVMLHGKAFSSLRPGKRGDVRNKEIGFVYQFHHLLPEFTALENVMMPLLIRGESRSKAANAAKILLDQVGIGHRLDHKPAALSGGERQRAAIARGLVTKPACLLADEPTGNLDQSNASNIIDLLSELNQEIGMALILVTHDLDLAARMDQQYLLDQGKLAPTKT